MAQVPIIETDTTGRLLRVLPTQSHTATVIFCHGLGQYNMTWAHVVAQALSPQLPHILWILPQSVNRRITINQGQQRPAWFDMSHLPPQDDEYDEAGISQSISVIENIILEQVQFGIDSRKIVLAGFSQGAALCLSVALTTLHELGGVVVLSGWLPFHCHMREMYTAFYLPTLWCHGIDDVEIPDSYAQDGICFMREDLGIPADCLTVWRHSNLGHNINDAELNEVATWLQSVLA